MIVKHKEKVLEDEFYFQVQQGVGRVDSQVLRELAEAESAYWKLGEQFRRACLEGVHMVIKKNPTPLNLWNLYGDEGDKYIVGGILLRRAKDWLLPPPISSSPSDLPDPSPKLATLDVRNLSLLRNRIPNLIVPLACIVDYYGLKFEC